MTYQVKNRFQSLPFKCNLQRSAAGPARLVTVSSDNKHTTRVWDWGGESRAPPRKLCAGVGFNGAPPQINGATWWSSAG
jgi:hypothetical protein